MRARICENSKCYTIQCQVKCFRCNGPTEPLPDIPLYAAGIDGKAHLEHTDDAGYTLVLELPDGPEHARVPVASLLHAAQPHLPTLKHISGLEIMDTLSNAALLIRTKNSGHWPGWVIYLLERLQDTTDPAAFQDVLKDLQHNIKAVFIQGEEPEERRAWNGILPLRHETGRGYKKPETP